MREKNSYVYCYYCFYHCYHIIIHFQDTRYLFAHSHISSRYANKTQELLVKDYQEKMSDYK